MAYIPSIGERPLRTIAGALPGPQEETRAVPAVVPQFDPSAVAAQTSPQPQAPVSMEPVLAQQTVTTTPGVKLSPQSIAEMDANAAKLISATQDVAAAEQQAAQAQTLALEDQRIKLGQIEAEQQKLRDEQQQRIDEVWTKYNDARAEADKKGKYDQGSYFKKLGVGGNIGMAIAQGLGAFGAAMTGTQNFAAKFLSDAIDRDAKEQETAYEAAKDGASRVLSEYGVLRQNGLDRQQALVARKETTTQATIAKIREEASRYSSPIIQANAEKMIADLEGKLQGEKRALEIAAKNRSTVQSTYVAPGGGGVDAKEIKEQNEAIKTSADVQRFRDTREAEERFNAMVDAGASSVAVVDFVAGALKQGSFGTEMRNMLEKRGIVDSTGELIRSKIQGGENPKFVKAVKDSLGALRAISQARAEPQIRRLRAAGVPLDVIIGGQTMKEAEQNEASKTGAVKRNVVGK